MSNPKIDTPNSAEKDPDNWVSGEDPMTPSQASYLATLLEQAGEEPDVSTTMTKADASKKIDELRAKLKL